MGNTEFWVLVFSVGAFAALWIIAFVVFLTLARRTRLRLWMLYLVYGASLFGLWTLGALVPGWLESWKVVEELRYGHGAISFIFPYLMAGLLLGIPAVVLGGMALIAARDRPREVNGTHHGEPSPS
ncbi:MAG: hypothetical protein KDC38_09175 [Planctomycetes bacterium]|nr:hypothetical protein [Planctomycetota bacterium]